MGDKRCLKITPEMINAGLLELCSALPSYEFSHEEKRRAITQVVRAVLAASDNEELRLLAASVTISSRLE
jgi:hypothetical protein